MTTFRDRLRRLWTDERGFLGTAAAIALALGTAGASAATNIYATKKAGDVNKKALEAQERESLRETAARKAEYDQAIALDKQRWADYVRVHEPVWQQGSRALAGLTEIAGMTGPAPQLPSGSAPPTPGAVPPGSVATPPMPVSGAQPRSGARVVTGPAIAMPRATGGMSLQDLMALASQATQRGPRYGYGPQGYPGPVES